MQTLQVTYLNIELLRASAGNPRTHSRRQKEQLARAIKRFGFTVPVVVDEEGAILAGHARVEAARMLGMVEVPTLQLADMSEVDKRAYVIADNKLAQNAGWDPALLKAEFEFLTTLDFDFDVAVTGFELPEIDGLLFGGGDKEPKPTPDDAPAPASGEPPCTRLGDVWAIGPHRLICGDALAADTYVSLLDEEKAGMVFADAPYNVPIAGHVSGLGKAQHREFAMASGEMSSAAFEQFLFDVFTQLTKVTTDGSIHFHCMDWRHMSEMLRAGGAAYTELKNLCVWAKTNGGMGSLYRSAHELVFVYKLGRAPHVNNIELGKNGRYRTNIWTYAGANSFRSGRDEDLADHPTVKPVGLVMDAILDCSRRGDIVLDPFAGSGTTLLAAHRTGRRGYGVEIDPIYCDVIIRRLRERAGLEATLAGQSFDQVAAERAAASLEDVA
jgi:DNA modification methylase